MKTKRNLIQISLLGTLLSALPATVQAQLTFTTTNDVATIAFDQIGAVAGKQYSGDDLAVVPSPEGAQLRCVFQRLNARLKTEGLWLASTVDGAKGQPFRVIARAVGRGSAESLPLPLIGKVEVSNHLARFIRPGLTEEYSVSVDGLRQDFVIERRPEGTGPVRLELEVDRAKAEAMAGGARLVLDDGGRQMVYNRLKAVDARGTQLAAKLEVLSANRLAVVLEDADVQYPVRIDPTFSDANWSALGSGMNGEISALAVSGNILYAGGLFTNAGGVAANYIAQWNGSSWSALGSGMSGGDSYGNPPNVRAIAVLGTNLYAGGMFTTAGGVSANCIAQWNGSSWSALGSGMAGSDVYQYGPSVVTLAVSGTNLYAGGNFTYAGGVTVNGIAEWNGSSWSALGSGVNQYNLVFALAVSGTNLYAGGNFAYAGGMPANDIAQWNGSSWSALGSGLGSYPLALAVSGTNLYAGGNFVTAGGVAAYYIAQWNGSSWSALGLGMNNQVEALAVSGANLYAGGFFSTAGGVTVNSIAQWNGSSWSALGSGPGFDVTAVALGGNNLYVGGNGAGVSEAMGSPIILTTDGNFGFNSSHSLFGFDVYGSIGSTQKVLGSTNLLNWVPMQTNVLSNSLWYFSDPSASNFTRRFYRISAP